MSANDHNGKNSFRRRHRARPGLDCAVGAVVARRRSRIARLPRRLGGSALARKTQLIVNLTQVQRVPAGSSRTRLVVRTIGDPTVTDYRTRTVRILQSPPREHAEPARTRTGHPLSWSPLSLEPSN